MDNKRLMHCLDADFTRLREVAAAADPNARVPSCPDWTVADLVRHVGMVYLDKVGAMRTGKESNQWPLPGTEAEEPLPLLDRAYAELTAEFATRAPESPSYTWFEPDQTVGFWIRRMAQETVIHRVDAELGAGVPIAAIPDDLARDGVDEFLVAFVAYQSRAWPDYFAETLASADGRAVRLEANGSAWLVRPTTEEVEVAAVDGSETVGASTAAVVRGEPKDLLLWVWNRTGDDAVIITGAPDAVTRLRRVFVTGSQ